ncbi:Hypothetical protein VV1_0792 [Vibrio vulnificus CMCP6]|uniref:Uncharacterized protein n=1 Tax=Vibrio vulnificus (strain CMCP6) TaxID=216895 RepID=A0A3Q0L2P2_VIBVU|nr:Hypothetical protein VV1_0792 [Vibrio vulnificus CMCP6]
MPEAAFGNALTATDNDKAKPTTTRIMKCQNRATVLAIRWVPAFARMTKIRKEKAELSSAAKNKKTQHTAATPPTVIPAPIRMARQRLHLTIV